LIKTKHGRDLGELSLHDVDLWPFSGIFDRMNRIYRMATEIFIL
jgi:hypothetical protein